MLNSERIISAALRDFHELITLVLSEKLDEFGVLTFWMRRDFVQTRSHDYISQVLHTVRLLGRNLRNVVHEVIETLTAQGSLLLEQFDLISVHVSREVIVKLLVRVIDQQLLQRVVIQNLKAKDVEHRNEFCISTTEVAHVLTVLEHFIHAHDNIVKHA